MSHSTSSSLGLYLLILFESGAAQVLQVIPTFYTTPDWVKFDGRV